jgi:hypothetical protein
LQKRRSIFIEPPHLRFSFIRQKADEFRARYVTPPELLPVPIEKIVEIDFGLIPIPIQGLLNSEDIDGFLTNDLKSICIDREIYLDPWQDNRLRFTYAHEIGHLVLHRAELQRCRFRNPEEWMHFHEDFLEEDLNWFEQQAREFGGRLLVPTPALEVEIGAHADKIELYWKKGGVDEDGVIEAVSREICKKFRVSAECIIKRVRKEKLSRLFRKRS